jgi:hypothetical protein
VKNTAAKRVATDAAEAAGADRAVSQNVGQTIMPAALHWCFPSLQFAVTPCISTPLHALALLLLREVSNMHVVYILYVLSILRCRKTFKNKQLR